MNRYLALAVCAAASFAASLAHAQVSTPFLTLHATDGNTAQVSTYLLSSPFLQQISPNGYRLDFLNVGPSGLGFYGGTITDGFVIVDADTQTIELDFAYTARPGDVLSTIDITITPGTAMFAAIDGATLGATASATIINEDIGQSTAHILPQGPELTHYLNYDASGTVGGLLTDRLTGDPDGTPTTTSATDFSIAAGMVTSLSAEYAFRMSSSDSVRVTALIGPGVPAPSAYALLAIAGISASRRRR